ncbi:Protein CBG03576 [Caenorhabditis briggsae]|uniref:Sdz-33 F-box domain-containing protein n=3 Tax=Caenorhabditis briggsae TaxID=6238 RepID=A0AAE9DFP1_CAEBR|nr:Protein CBG03576 [Caenorhabditis briggsae]ULU02531.1 hypothetical protein L3Y34_002248 [Caenorhabditis briggsae]CAP24446.1 Protein CBG03576 [Caenorhabditis briggsae]
MTPPTLLDVPKLPMSKMVNFLSPKSLINFALSSPKIQEFIKLQNLNVEKLSLNISQKGFVIRLKFFYFNKPLVWKFFTSYTREVKLSTDKIKLCETPIEFGKQAVEWLTDLIRFPVTAVQITGPSFPEIENILQWTKIHECEKLTMNFIDKTEGGLEKFTDLESFDLNGSDWLKPEHLKNCAAKRITLYTMDWDANQLNQFIRCWFEGIDQPINKLENIEIQLKSVPMEGLPIEQIVSGFETKPWDPTQRARIYRNYHKKEFEGGLLNLEHALDILRPDGKLASVSVFDKIVNFVVWHQRFPVASEQSFF